MARSTYIYLIRMATLEAELIGAFTVKREAILWALRNGWPPEHANLSRMRDGMNCELPYRKDEEQIPWTEERAV